MDERTKLLASERQPLEALTQVDEFGIYAWWAMRPLTWPAGFPPVGVDLPLYIGIAKDETLARRAKFHLTNTRGSILRRKIAALWDDELQVRDAIIPDVRQAAKFRLPPPEEERMSAWMRANLRVTWVGMPLPGALEQVLVPELLPPLNDHYAAGSPYKAHVRRITKLFRTGR